MTINKLIKTLITSFMIFLTFNCGQSSRDGFFDIKITLIEDLMEIEITRFLNENDDIPPFDEYFGIEGYPNSYVTHRLTSNRDIALVYGIKLGDYWNNINPDRNNPIPLPNQRLIPTPLTNLFGGGDGVGNGRVHGGFSYFGNQAFTGIYQNKKKIGFFYSKNYDIGTDNIVSARQYINKKRATASIVGPDQSGNQGGGLLVLPDLTKMKTKKRKFKGRVKRRTYR